MDSPQFVREEEPEPRWPQGWARPLETRHAGAASGAWSRFETRFPLDWRHGPWTFAEVLRRPLHDVSALAPRRAGGAFSCERATFLDVEAGTSPRGGACALLLGLGRYEDD